MFIGIFYKTMNAKKYKESFCFFYRRKNFLKSDALTTLCPPFILYSNSNV